MGTGLLVGIRLGDGSARGVGAAGAVAAAEAPADAAGEGEGARDGLDELGGTIGALLGDGEPLGDGGNDWAGHGPLARTGVTGPNPSNTRRTSTLATAGPISRLRALRRRNLGDVPQPGIHSFGPTVPRRRPCVRVAYRS